MTENPAIGESISGNTISWTLDLTNYPATSEIFGVSNTQVTLQGYAEFYPAALTGDSNARFYDEASYMWPEIPEDTTDEAKSSLPVSLFALLAVPVLAIAYRKFSTSH